MRLNWVMHSQRKTYHKPNKVKNKENLKISKELDENKCRFCGISKQLTSHHILNRSLGGDDSLHNLITLCFWCHRNLHDGKIDLREYLNSIYGKHPVPEWFRWEKTLRILNKRK